MRIMLLKYRYISTLLLISALSSIYSLSALASDDDAAKAQNMGLNVSDLNDIPAEYADIMMAQIPLKKAADLIHAAVEAGDSSGFTGIALGEDSVDVWWKGAMPKSVRQAVGQAGKTVRVTVNAARYSLAELREAASKITDKMRADPESTLHTVEIPVDGSGLILVSDIGAPAVEEQLGNLGVSITDEQGERILLIGRLNDWAPFWGGSRINNGDIGVYCSAGFGVTDGYSDYILTAGHCGGIGTPFYNGNWTNFIGYSAYESVWYDILLIPASAGSYIYWGGVGSNESSKRVAGWGAVYPGESLCGSPSVTGSVCGATASTEFTFSFCATDPYGNYECYGDLVKAWNGTRAFQPGDSGGPVVSLSGSQVVAKGTLTGIGSGFFVFQDFYTTANYFGITTR